MVKINRSTRFDLKTAKARLPVPSTGDRTRTSSSLFLQCDQLVGWLVGFEPTLCLHPMQVPYQARRQRDCLVVGKGFEPFRSSPSGQSPGFIRPRRTPVLPTIAIEIRLCSALSLL